jgi:peptidoglycan/LPS O-acetylase OafA/YrhL
LTGDFTRGAARIGITWSLAVEEQFYLLFPYIVRLLSRKALLVLMGFCVLAVPLLRTLLVMKGWQFEQVYPLLPCRADALALGVIAGIMMRTEAAKGWISEHRKILFLCLLALIASLPTVLKWTSYRYVGTIGYSMLAVMYFLLIVLVLIAPTTLMKKTFCAGWLRRLGVISYCPYLIHEPVRRSLFLLLKPGKNRL